MSDDTTLQIDGLTKILKALKGKQPVARVGILGNSAFRGDGTTNAEIGAAHEFGTSRLPQRSFLRVPLADHLGKRLVDSGAFDKESLARVIATGNLRPWVEKVGILAEGVVLDAFDGGGFGEWKPSNMAGKKNQQTLVETGQLRNSITSDVQDG